MRFYKPPLHDPHLAELEHKAMIGGFDYVPRGFVHAILTLSDDTEALYFVDDFYNPIDERGARFDNPRLHIVANCTSRNLGKGSGLPSFDPLFRNVELLRDLNIGCVEMMLADFGLKFFKLLKRASTRFSKRICPPRDCPARRSV
jgi:hypothetical protein